MQNSSGMGRDPVIRWKSGNSGESAKFRLARQNEAAGAADAAA